MPDSCRVNLLIRASAGTGKTFQLSNRFLGLAAAGEPLDGILATTFTRKGAGEILDRVLLRLADAACSTPKLNELCKHLPAKLDANHCLELLEEMLRGLHRLRTGTLDSFFIQIARNFSLELGHAPGWQICDEIVDGRLQAEAIRRVLADQSTSDAVRLMNLLSKGETSAKIGEQLMSLVKALYTVFQESPEEAWRLPRQAQLSDLEVQAAIEALAAVELSTDKRCNTAREKDRDRASASDWSGFLGNGLSARVACGDCTYYKKPLDPDLVEAYRPLVHHAKAVLVNQIANQTDATRRLLERFDVAYRRLKLDHHAMRFEDVTRLVGQAELAERLAEIEYRLDGRVVHLLLDEFQDTSPAQWRVLRHFARRIFESGGRGSFFCVGDVKQAIYGWRGGVAEIFDTLEGEFPSLTLQPLNESFRSSQIIIDAVNRVFENLSDNAALADDSEAARRWAARFQRHTTTHAEMPGYCRLSVAPAAVEGENQQHRTMAFAAGEVARLHRELPGHTVGVLVRRNDAVARMIYELRQNHQIDASEEGGNPLTDSAAVGLVLSLLSLSDHPGDTTARFHIARSPLGACIGLIDHEDAAAAARTALEIRRRLMDDGYGPTIYAWAKHLCPSCDAREFNRLMQLVELAYGYEPAATCRADDFVKLVSEKRVESPTSALVRVMTFHQAKGLQFDVVVLPELDYRLVGQAPKMVVERPNPAGPISRVCRYVSDAERACLPDGYARMFAIYRRQVVEESMCVLYVAMTRAIHALHMIVAPSSDSEKKLPGTVAGVLRAALVGGGRLAAGSTPYEHGDPLWWKALKSAPAQVEAAEPEPMMSIQLAPPPSQSARGLEFAAPSRLSGESHVKLASRLRLDATEALERGTLVHTWFEEIEWLDDGEPDEALLRRVATRVVGAGVDVPATMRHFRAALRKPAIKGLLTRAMYIGPQGCFTAAGETVVAPRLEVDREWPFVIREGDMLVSGQIDRLVVLYDGQRPVWADVVDFKTDRLAANDPGAIAARAEEYRAQLAAIRRAAARVLGLTEDRVTARLALVDPGVVVRVE